MHDNFNPSPHDLNQPTNTRTDPPPTLLPTNAERNRYELVREAGM